jgi:hypothetical protein
VDAVLVTPARVTVRSYAMTAARRLIDTTMDAVDLLEEWWKQHGI